MADRQTVLRPLGLVTQPNEFGQYADGALSRGRNCVMRNPGELDAAPSMFASQTAGAVNNVLHSLMPLNAGACYELGVSGGGVWQITERNNAVPLTSFASLTGLFSTTGRITPQTAKERVLFNSNNGILVGDSLAPTTSGERALRLAGLPQLSWRSATQAVAASPSGAIPAPGASSTQALIIGYQAIHTRTYADGYKIVSVPTPIIKRFTVGGSFDLTFSFSVGWATADVALVGDVIELYRSDGLLILNSASVFHASEPPSVYKLVASRTLTSADIAASNYTFVDNSRMSDAPYYSTSGRELYSNPGNGVGGALAINRQPPLAAVVAKFDGRVFYGNTTDRPKMQVVVPAGIGTTQSGVVANTPYWRANGIGERTATGVTFTNGSPVVSVISATDIVGLVPGMSIVGAGWPLSVRILSVAATTVTMNANYTGGTVTLQQANFYDVLYIGFNNTLTMNPYRFGDLGDLLAGFGAGSIFGSPSNQFEVTASIAPYLGTVGTMPIAGQYNPAVSFSVEPKNHGSAFVSMQVMATHGANFSPPLAEYTAAPTIGTVTQFTRTTQKNRVTWCKDQQPEHVPPGSQANESFVGLREVIAAVNTKDALWFACLDGIFRLTGAGGQYRVDPIDSTKIICGPRAITTLDEQVLIYTNFGMLAMNSESRDNLSDMVIGDLLPGPEYLETAGRILQSNEQDLEIVYADVLGGSQLYVYATKPGAGWTTLENNPANLSNITALAYQRSPVSGDPRLLVGASPGGGVAASYAGWGNTAAWLVMDVAYQPLYGDDPMTVKTYSEMSFLWASDNTGKTLRPVWNGVPVGSANIVLYQNAAYARAGVPRAHACSHSISPGFDSVTATGTQPRFLGLSLKYKARTNQAKQR